VSGKEGIYTEGTEGTEVTEKRKARRARCIVPLQEKRYWWRAKRAGQAPPYKGKEKRLWREADGFVFGVDPDGDDSGFLGFFGVVVGDGHGAEGADGYADFDAGA